MSHKKLMSSLKGLIRLDFEHIDPQEYVERLKGESDRGAIILAGSMIDDAVGHMLASRMPALNSDERARMFGYDGVAGSFSSRLRLAHALGYIDRDMRRRVEVVKEMRNAAAHAHQEISFETPAICEAVRFISKGGIPDDYNWTRRKYRYAFLMICGWWRDNFISPKPITTDTAPSYAMMQQAMPR
jgi:hypothetical protein